MEGVGKVILRGAGINRGWENRHHVYFGALPSHLRSYAKKSEELKKIIQNDDDLTK